MSHNVSKHTKVLWQDCTVLSTLRFCAQSLISPIAPEIGRVLPYTATVRAKRSDPSILYNTPVRVSWAFLFTPFLLIGPMKEWFRHLGQTFPSHCWGKLCWNKFQVQCNGVNRLLSNNNTMKSQARPRRRIGVKATSVEPSLEKKGRFIFRKTDKSG